MVGCVRYGEMATFWATNRYDKPCIVYVTYASAGTPVKDTPLIVPGYSSCGVVQPNQSSVKIVTDVMCDAAWVSVEEYSSDPLQERNYLCVNKSFFFTDFRGIDIDTDGIVGFVSS